MEPESWREKVARVRRLEGSLFDGFYRYLRTVKFRLIDPREGKAEDTLLFSCEETQNHVQGWERTTRETEDRSQTLEPSSRVRVRVRVPTE